MESGRRCQQHVPLISFLNCGTLNLSQSFIPIQSRLRGKSTNQALPLSDVSVDEIVQPLLLTSEISLLIILSLDYKEKRVFIQVDTRLEWLGEFFDLSLILSSNAQTVCYNSWRILFP